ncbi:DUF2326 domain-containing protein [Caulobacter segnis]|uniref:DUF2326 domain-containing protein n=1 Tax=Caulobacter segnis TaxID=88688 RepID=UPI002865CF7C|nr:DUF2326 domain-containing protein [Caulobacter segnis]MDR6624476.1 uncharacterized protein YydD (DUF2326 family) [Caulobacter segnis]
MAGRAEGALKADALADWAFSGEFSGPVGVGLGVDRSLCNPSVVQRRVRGKAGQLSTSALAQELGEDWFKLGEKQGPGGPSFRQMMPYFARRRRDGGYDHPARSSRAQTPAASEINLAHLFGLDAEIVRRLHVAKAALKQNDAARKVLRDLDKAASGTTRADLEAQLSARIAAASLASDTLREKIETFNVLPAFRELERELSSLHQEARDLSDADVLDQEVIELNLRALGAEQPLAPTNLESLFGEANVVFPDLVARRYDEVAQFHARLVENRREHLTSEIEAARRRIQIRAALRESVEARRRSITASLRVSGPAEELLALRDELSAREAEVRNLEGRLAEARSLDERGEALERDIDEAIRALRADRRERSSIVDDASKTFSSISQRLYERPGELAISATDAGLKFLPSTPSDNSAGVMSMEIFCFDWTIATLCARRGMGPGFLIHDSHLFEPVDGRQFGKALALGARLAQETGVQYIVTLNSDELQRAEIESGEALASYVVEPRLSDEPDGGLFGIRFD